MSAPFPKYDSCSECNTPMYAPKRRGLCEECQHEETMRQAFGPVKEVQASLDNWS